MLSIITITVWLLYGALVGWLAVLVASTGAQPDIYLYVAIGVVSAMIGGWSVAPLFDCGSSTET